MWLTPYLGDPQPEGERESFLVLHGDLIYTYTLPECISVN